MNAPGASSFCTVHEPHSATTPSAHRPPGLDRRVRPLCRLARNRWGRRPPHDVPSLLTDDWSGGAPLGLNTGLTLAELEAAVLLHNVRCLLSAAKTEGVLPEAPAQLTPDIRLELERPWRPPGFSEDVRAGHNNPYLRRSVEPLHWTQRLAETAGLFDRAPNGFTISAEGVRLAPRARAGELYVLLFRSCFRRFNLACLDHWPDVPELQDLVPLVLWTLTGREGQAWLEASYWEYGNLPPAVRERIEKAGRGVRFRCLMEARVLGPLADFGLLEPQPSSPERLPFGETPFRRTPLLRRFISFNVPEWEPEIDKRDLRLLR